MRRVLDLVRKMPLEQPEPDPPLRTLWATAPEMGFKLSPHWVEIARQRPNLNLARDIRAGRIPAFREVEEREWGTFEAKALKNIWGGYTVYVKFNHGEVR